MVMSSQLEQRLLEIYQRLLFRYGPQNWWPADGPFEVAVGAILTQATSWKNVEKAISNLKEADVLQSAALRELELERLYQLIYPCGFYKVKALKLKAFAKYLAGYGDDLAQLFSQDLDSLRQELLSIYGIGEETADSILLYAADRPVFVIDAYTRRILSRLGLLPQASSYSALQSLFMENLPPDVPLYNEYHALLVRHGKETCRRAPLCQGCCLKDLCSSPRPGL